MSPRQSKNEEGAEIITAGSFAGDLGAFLAQYNYQPELTSRLDALENTAIDQPLLNEIVLWKVNRYVRIARDDIEQIHRLRVLQAGEHGEGEQVLRVLLKLKGVDLPMASTILRFANPRVFQIIDRHAYRAVYGKTYPLFQSTPTQRKVSLYLDYIDALIDLCRAENLEFGTIDRLLYIFDKKNNGKL